MLSNSKELDKFHEIFDLEPISKLSSVGVWHCHGHCRQFSEIWESFHKLHRIGDFFLSFKIVIVSIFLRF
ncbi:hypothetical protein C4Q31_00145 [Leptospira borgpetersenii serovar Ceylonica]|nr:hypothetical protein C4Q31_00145 [Leptospira borgpetersenii serovar Ceylonica]